MIHTMTLLIAGPNGGKRFHVTGDTMIRVDGATLQLTTGARSIILDFATPEEARREQRRICSAFHDGVLLHVIDAGKERRQR